MKAVVCSTREGPWAGRADRALGRCRAGEDVADAGLIGRVGVGDQGRDLADTNVEHGRHRAIFSHFQAQVHLPQGRSPGDAAREKTALKWMQP